MYVYMIILCVKDCKLYKINTCADECVYDHSLCERLQNVCITVVNRDNPLKCIVPIFTIL